MKVNFDNSYARLPDRFFTRLDPTPVAAPQTIRVNVSLARQLGFDPDWLASDEGAAFAAGNQIVDGSVPIATVYGGHQFGGWSGRLGDGRAHLLGEVIAEDGERFDLQLKGSGQTPYSRRGDGRSPLGPVLREYIVSEAMYALGIPTTRSLVATTTGEGVRRETMLPGGVLVRVAKSHIRVGTFEWFASRGDLEALETLAAHVAERHYPDVDYQRPIDLLAPMAKRQAKLIARWQLVGFIHGVMNTDNMLISGETIDYGPCAFMNEYDPATVYSSIDHRGRYAYGNQPRMAQWNVSRFAEALLATTDEGEDAIAEAQSIIDAFPEVFREAYGAGLGEKLGLTSFAEPDWDLATEFLELLYESKSDYTLAFRRLAELVDDQDGVADRFEFGDAFTEWLQRWRARIEEDGRPADEVGASMRAVNPAIIPRNHRVDAAITAAVNDGDLSPFHNLVDVLASPFELPDDPTLLDPPVEGERVTATFCGT